ncbi:hypothetical protein Bca101_066341 [Brassica carinata]
MDRKVSWVSAQRGSVFSVASVRGLLSTRQGRACRSSRTGDLTSGSPITVASGLLAYSISLGVAFRCYVYSFLVTYFNIRCLVSTEVVWNLLTMFTKFGMLLKEIAWYMGLELGKISIKRLLMGRSTVSSKRVLQAVMSSWFSLLALQLMRISWSC